MKSIKKPHTIILISGLLLANFVSSARAFNESSIHECDRQAYHSFFDDKIISNVDSKDIDVEKGLPACREAVEKHPDISRFQYQYGRVLQKAGKIKKSFSYYKKAAEVGNVLAMEALFTIYDTGIKGLVDKDGNKSFEWLNKAVDAGSVNAMHILAVSYMSGINTDKDIDKGMKWLEEAANKGNVSSMLSISSVYIAGEIVGKDINKAIEWLEKASDKKSVDAMFVLSNIYSDDTQSYKDLEKSEKWLKKAGEAGVENSDVLIARMYMN
ncbi:MAG: sel1 repeat family protein, partial [Alphaproteobacteria bacterium]|nr:sel1 repeat family protein [Alphaproteobacteria bacterium]